MGRRSRATRLAVTGVSDWQNVISDELRLEVRIEHEQGVPIKFTFQLLGLIDGDWIPIVRIDNSHDNLPPHRHVCHPDGTEQIKNFVAMLPESVVGHAQDDLQDNAQRYLDEFKRRMHNMQR